MSRLIAKSLALLVVSLCGTTAYSETSYIDVAVIFGSADNNLSMSDRIAEALE